ncbi:MAG: M28 family peptidase [Ignavibacteriaceae bacterium]|nr:M28 family peptidase [Ignavibacteriaceae bacterium]
MKQRFGTLISGLLILFIIFSPNIHSQGSNSVIQQIINQVNIDTLMFFVKELSGNIPTTIGGQPYTIVSRHKNNASNDKAGEYIKERLERYGVTTTLQSFSTTGKNVIGVKPGSVYPNKKYIICAHFDDMPSGSLAPGADDNASGTAAVMEAARIFRNYTFPYTIVYALWDEEEQGLVGSAYYASQARTAGDSIIGVFNMDMIAWDSNNDNLAEIHTRAVGTSLDLSSKMLEINSTYAIGLNPVIKNPGLTASDHASFWNNSYGAVLLIESYANDFNAYYHTVNDLITHFNQPYFLKSARMVIGATAAMAMNYNIQIEHTPIASSNYSGNILVTANVVSNLTIGTGNYSPKLYYRTGNGTNFTPFSMVSPSASKNASGVYNFIIPAQTEATIVQYYLAAQDSASNLVTTLPKGGSGFNPPGSVPPSTFYQFYVANTSLAFEDTANTITNWVISGTWGTTTSKFVSPPYSYTESPAGNYVASATYTMTMANTINLGDFLGATLEFSAQWAIEDNWDYGQIQITTDNGTTWTALAGSFTNPGQGTFQPAGQPLYDGAQSTWVNEMIPLNAYKNKPVKFRFYFRSDGSQQFDGWYVDNIKLKTFSGIPVELAAFSINPESDGVTLNWLTASELNNKGFKIQRMLGDGLWKDAAFIEGRGTTTEQTAYSYFDKLAYNGTVQYRLLQTDLDGTEKIYGPKQVNVNTVREFALEQNYPNPFNPVTTIGFTLPVSAEVELSLYDIQGSKVADIFRGSKEAGNHKIIFEASGLSSGVYIYKLSAGDKIQTRRMVILK